MDKPNIAPENIVSELSEDSKLEVGIESTPIAETITTSSAPPAVSSSSITKDPHDVQNDKNEIQDDEELEEKELSDLTNSDTEKADADWIGRVKDVIKDDEGQPAKEEDDAEALNAEYMKARFNVDVDAPIEEK